MNDDFTDKYGSTDPAEDAPAEEQASGVETTKLSRGWIVKSMLIMFVFFFLGFWGLLDALVIYPNRGRLHIDFAERDYLVASFEERQRTVAAVSILDPKAELERLKDIPPTSMDKLESSAMLWLESISRLNSLSALARKNEAEQARRDAGEEPQRTLTMFVNPAERKDELETRLATSTQPTPLSRWDMPVQWAFVIVGFGIGLPLLLKFLRHATQKHRFDHDTQTLTMSDGTVVTAAKLTDFDKRKWDKFLVYIRLEGESGERKIDLYRHVPLEDWIIALYERSPIYEPEEQDDTPENGSGAEPENAEQTPQAQA